MNYRFSSMLMAGILTVGLAACGTKTETTETTTTTTETAATDNSAMMSDTSATMSGGTMVADGETFTVQPVGEQMEFAQKEFSAKAGTSITVKFENTATSQAMIHNWTLLEPTADVMKIGAAAATNATKGYMPDDKAGIIAYTEMSKPGESHEVKFTVPSTPGDYPYVCLYPGHYVLMKGTLHVTA